MTALPVTVEPGTSAASLSPEVLWQVLGAVDVGLLVTDERRRILYVNAAFCRETGYGPEEVRGRTCGFLQGPGTDPADILALRTALDRGEPVSRVVLNYRKDGSPMWYRLRIQPIREEGAVRYFVGVQEDYSATHAAHAELERLAYLDALTGLGNRRAFDAELSRHLGDGEAFTLALLDLNGFKQINDERGHPAGDELLGQVGGCLGRAASGGGQAFRVGGDEFAVLLPGGAEADDRAAALLTPLHALEGGSLRAGLGLARFPDEASSGEALLRLADRRLYAHKTATKAGR